MNRRLTALFTVLLCAGAAQAAREPVLKQVDLPHSYYWRELYLPQLTTGPSSVSFLPDSDTLVYSMEGSLWRQRIGDDTATELTHAARAYDYQPDVSHDGRSVVFARYDGNAIELWRLDLASGREQALTSGGAVNVEPRLSPDGRQLAWVSTQGGGHFNLFIADLDAKGLHGVRPLLGERRSTIERYYYSAVDHTINPSWSPDGKTIYYVGNAEVAWGSGDLWAVPVAEPAARRRVLSEETSWAARPELSPDGKRLLFSSYHGRQWHQLWLSTPDGLAALPLSFGDFDRRNARWSPDGQRIAYIDNADGGTALRVMTVLGGDIRTLEAKGRHLKVAQAQLTLDIRDEHGQRVPARVSIIGSDGRAHGQDRAWLQADDGFDRDVQPLETAYFHCAPPCAVSLPLGESRVRVQRGFATRPWEQTVRLAAGSTPTVTAILVADGLPAEYGDFLGADLHVHMNYGGTYRNTPATLVAQADAEALDLVQELLVNKEERIPDIDAFLPGLDPVGHDRVMLQPSQEYHSSFWGHLGLLGLDDHFLLPDFTAYRHTALASAYPHNGLIADLAHAQNALVGYVHPFDTVPDPARDAVLSNALPADVIQGKIDYMEVVGFSDHHSTAAVWYRLLNLGFPVAAGAGTDAMANYASLRGPLGMNRVFLDTGGVRTPAAARAALKAGHGFASNGSLLGLLVDGAKPGAKVDAGAHAVRIALRSPVPVDHLELVHNGEVVHRFDLGDDRRHFDGSAEVKLGDGWLLLRAWNDGADPAVLDLYPYATTNPVWLGSGRAEGRMATDAAYFAAWLARVIEAASARDDYNTPAERAATLDYLEVARQRFLALEVSRQTPAEDTTE